MIASFMLSRIALRRTVRLPNRLQLNVHGKLLQPITVNLHQTVKLKSVQATQDVSEFSTDGSVNLKSQSNFKNVEILSVSEVNAATKLRESVVAKPLRLYDFGKITNTFLERTITDYHELEKESRSLFGAFDKIVLTQSEPSRLLNDSRFQLLFVTLLRSARQLSSVEFCEMFNSLLHHGLLIENCPPDFVDLRNQCTQVAFRLATLHVSRVSLSSQITFSYILKQQEAKLRPSAGKLFDALFYQLRLLIADKVDQFHRLTFDELAYVIAVFSSPEAEAGTGDAENSVTTGKVKREVISEATRRIGEAISNAAADERPKSSKPNYERVVEALHAFASCGFYNEPIVKSCFKFVELYHEPLESRVAAMRSRRQKQLQRWQMRQRKPTIVGQSIDAAESTDDDLALQEIEDAKFMEKCKVEKMKLIEALFKLHDLQPKSQQPLIAQAEADLLQNPQFKLTDQLQLLDTYFLHSFSFESTQLARVVLNSLLSCDSDSRNLFGRALRRLLLHADWSFFATDSKLAASVIDRIADLSKADGDFEFDEYAARVSFLVRLYDSTEDAAIAERLSTELSPSRLQSFLDTVERQFTSESTTSAVIDELRRNEVIATSLVRCQQRGLLKADDKLTQCLFSIAERNATLRSSSPGYKNLMDSITDCLHGFPVERVQVVRPSDASIPHQLRFADLLVTFSSNEVDLRQLFGSPGDESVAGNIVKLGCNRVALQVVQDHAYFQNISRSSYPKKMLLDFLRGARDEDAGQWCVVRLTESDWRARELMISEKMDKNSIIRAKRSLLLHLFRLSASF